MKRICLAALAALTVMAAGAFDYDVKKSKIKPQWSGAKAGVWTMDHESALANAAAEGKYTLMLYSGMWWCPHCQNLEENVLVKPDWKKYVKDCGYYLTVLDFPYRDGRSNWCWLWDESYRKSAKLTAEEATEEIIRMYAVQDAYALEGAQRQTAANYVVTTVGKGKNAEIRHTLYEKCPVSEYSRIGYPTILVIAPDGTVVGRFSVSKSNAEYLANPVGYVKAKVNALTHADAAERLIGTWSLAYAREGRGGYGALQVTVAKKGKVKVAGTDADGGKVKATSTVVTGAEFCAIPLETDDGAFTLRIANDFTATVVGDDGIGLVDFGPAGMVLGPAPLFGVFEDFPLEIGDKILTDPTAVSSSRFTAKGTKLVSTCGVKISVTAKTGAFKGSFNVEIYEKGRNGKLKVTLNGVFVNGKGYGTAVPQGADAVGFRLDTVKPDDCEDDGICDGDC